MWWFRWHARRFFRSVMNPIDPEAAKRWERRLRYFYIFFGANALIVSYKYWTRRKEELKDFIVKDPTPAHGMARNMMIGGNYKIISGGFNRSTQVYDINVEEYRDDYNQKQKRARDLYIKEINKTGDNSDNKLDSNLI